MSAWIDHLGRSNAQSEAVGDPRPVLPPVVAGEAVEREKVAVLQVDRAGILVGDVEIVGRRRQHQLDPRGQPLGTAPQRADQRPAQIRGERADPAELPAVLAAIDSDRGLRRFVGVIGIGAGQGGERQFLAHPGQAAQVPSGAGEGALRVLAVDAEDGEAVGLQLDLAAEQRVVEPEAGVDRRQGERECVPACRSLRRPWNAQPAIET